MLSYSATPTRVRKRGRCAAAFFSHLIGIFHIKCWLCVSHSDTKLFSSLNFLVLCPSQLLILRPCFHCTLNQSIVSNVNDSPLIKAKSHLIRVYKMD